jgi:hypothetical protein
VAWVTKNSNTKLAQYRKMEAGSGYRITLARAAPGAVGLVAGSDPAAEILASGGVVLAQDRARDGTGHCTSGRAQTRRVNRLDSGGLGVDASSRRDSACGVSSLPLNRKHD